MQDSVTRGDKLCGCCHCCVVVTHKHHILPRVMGGVDHPTNIVECCESCHGKIHGRKMLDHSKLTRLGMVAAKARGQVFGGMRPEQDAKHKAMAEQTDEFCRKIKPVIEDLKEAGYSYQKIAGYLNEKGFPTRQGGKWYASTVSNYYKRVV